MTNDRLNNSGASYFITGLLVGGLAAVVTTLLTAPQSGKETRKQLLQAGIDLGNDALESADDAVAQVRKKGQKLSSDVQDKVSALKQRGQDLIDEQRGRLSSIVAGENSNVRAASK